MHQGDSYEAIGVRMRKLRGNKAQRAVAHRLKISQAAVSLAERGIRITVETAELYDQHYRTGGELEARVRAVAKALKGGSATPPPGTTHGRVLTLPEHLATLVEAGGGLVAAPLPDLLTGMSGGRTMPLPDGLYRVITSTGEVMVMVIDRRLFVGAGLAVPVVAHETSRQGILRSLVGDGWGSVEEWQAIVREYCVTYLHTPPAEVFTRLSTDLAALGEAAGHERSETGRGELCKTGAMLASLMSSTVANLGDTPTSVRWARAARQMADTSGDTHTRVWVRGREVVLGLYQRRPVGELLRLAEEGVAIGEAQGPPCTSAWPELLTGKAQALALTGQAAQAETTLCEVRDNFDRMPADTTRDTESLLGWYEHNVRFTESYVYSHLGNYARADRAQTAALALYPATELRGPVMIELQRALCLVRTGDITPGVEHAHTVMSGLPREHHVRPVVDLGHKVLDAVPATEQGRDGVRAFRAYLGHEVA